MDYRYNASRSDGKAAAADLNSASAESLYHDYRSIMAWMAIRPLPVLNMESLYHRNPNVTSYDSAVPEITK